jgi:hypothetical protein
VWRNRFLVGAFASGVAWGAAAVVLVPAHSLPHQVFVSFVIAGMAAGAVATLSPVMSAFALFAIPARAPIIPQFLLREGPLHFPMSFMGVLFGLAMMTVARHVHATMREALWISQRNVQLAHFDALTELPNRVLLAQALEFLRRRAGAGNRRARQSAGTNNEIHILLRATGERLASFGRGGRQAGQFHWVHAIGIDSQGNLYAGEVDSGKRAQKFRRAAEEARDAARR